MDNRDIFETRIDITELNETVSKIKDEISKVIVGQSDVVENLIIAILTNGHVLIEGVPGVAKTLMAKLIAKCFEADYSRIQFTPDLMPSDITGTNMYNIKTSEFEFNKGPVFANIILADEINRAPAKTQSALFEVMEERQITVDGKKYNMDLPFLVFATQNPIEHEGTYRLPEAQLDRFMFKINIDYPSQSEEVNILMNNHLRKSNNEIDEIEPVMTKEKVLKFQEVIREVRVEDNIMNYIASIVAKTRDHEAIFLGASPRASINILNSAKTYAVINNRDFVTPEDVMKMAYLVLNHRIELTPEKEMEGVSTVDIIKSIVQQIEIPR